MVAAQLARRGIGSVLVEGGGRMGQGIAYATREPAHVLNVRAEVMSAWPEEPDDFARAITAEGGSAKDFSERRRFGRYLRAILDEAVAAGLVTAVEAEAVSAARDGDGWTIALADGRTVSARALVLAIGNQEPAAMGVAEGISDERFVNNPWGAAAKTATEQAVASDANVLILGTGLTAVDLILALDANGHRGRIVALSRRGQMPRGHAPFEPAPVAEDELPLGNVLALWGWLRRRGAKVGWRAAVDSLRPHTRAIWRGLGAVDQDRFLRHARPWWDVHRHRIAPEVAERMKRLIGGGRLQVRAGRVRGMREVLRDEASTGSASPQDERIGLEVAIDRRGKGQSLDRLGTNGTLLEKFDVAFNCTGPLGAMARTRNPVLKHMLGDGLVAIDRLGMGLEVDDRDRAGEGVWALGPLTKGRYWEIIAVPDIRGQAAAVAADIATELEA
jgi:uncharacterized NAD(P)/FAD-binding protein YdhS